MNVVTILGMVAAFALLLPVIFILACRLAGNRSLVALLIYFFTGALYNLMAEGFIPVSDPVAKSVGYINNFLDIPLMLIGLLLFSTSANKQKILTVSLVLFVIYELIIGAMFGFVQKTIILILGPGIVMMLLYASVFFTQYVKLSITNTKYIGKTMMITSILFAYACFAMIYVFFYLIKTSPVKDVFIIYYIASIFTSLLMSAGILLLYKRSRHIKEVQLTRKELAVFFNS